MFRLSGLRNGVRGLETRFGMNFDKLFTGIALRDTWTDFSVLDCVRHKTTKIAISVLRKHGLSGYWMAILRCTVREITI